ncbi:hypothetical protein BDV96DRAFT_597690 [Lophiotrema nucula]|uniref:BTB domain-containing protein n=1 Tax=Lophiotrema nucula TaxID=690887 RepID=A0A6A5ZGF0_9PLEO|nr:hypothetical protein BDV96DRAFT_597690 [Lophiotrema nucula]
MAKAKSKGKVRSGKGQGTLRISAVSHGGSIIVKAGGSQEGLYLHKAFLSNYSGYFEGALSGSFSETEDGVVTIQDVDEKAFNVFADFIYHHKIPDGLKGWAECAEVELKTGNTETDDMNLDAALLLWYRTYILADRLLVPALKDALLEDFFKEFEDGTSYPHGQGVKEVVENLMDTDPLIDLLVDAQCLWPDKGNPRWMESFEKLPRDFLARVTLKLYTFWETDRKKGRKPRVLQRSDYGLPPRTPKQKRMD